MKLVFDPVLPPPILLLLAILLGGATAWLYLGIGRRISAARNVLLLALRLTAIGLVILILLQPSTLEEVPRAGFNKVLLVALDTSSSMNQRDAGGGVTRFDAAREFLMDSPLLQRREGREQEVRFFEFHEEAFALDPGQLPQLRAGGGSTRIHTAIESMLQSLQPDEGADSLILLTDGHDFDLVPPVRTGTMALARRVPIFPVPFGEAGRVRDGSVRITSFQPYSYVKQDTAVHANIRLIGCDFLPVTVQLLRQGDVVQSRNLNADERSELAVEFVVNEEVSGQFEYEVRLLPLPEETDTSNNSAITFLRVIDEKMHVLLLEGSPHWETTFLIRALQRNDKVDLFGIVQYTPNAARSIRSEGIQETVHLPATAEQFAAYDVILLGRRIDRILTLRQVELLEEFVRDKGGAVVFFRGEPFEGSLAEAHGLEPVLWGTGGYDRVRLEVARAGRQLPPTRLLAEEGEKLNELPELTGVRNIRERKGLAEAVAEAVDMETGHRLPAIVHRPTGRGQVVTIAVDGLWRWAFHEQATPFGGIYDRFWDQMLHWMMASSDHIPTRDHSFRASTANLLLGEKIHFRLGFRQPDMAPDGVALRLFREDQPVGETMLAPESSIGRSGRLAAEFVPDGPGRYRAAARLPNGEELEARFIVFLENLEETEVAVDLNYLRLLAEASGGRQLRQSEVNGLAETAELQPAQQEPLVKRSSLWDRPLLFYLICLMLAADWYLRRRWGLT
jgi:hypothetical protein